MKSNGCQENFVQDCDSYEEMMKRINENKWYVSEIKLTPLQRRVYNIIEKFRPTTATEINRHLKTKIMDVSNTVAFLFSKGLVTYDDSDPCKYIVTTTTINTTVAPNENKKSKCPDCAGTLWKGGVFSRRPCHCTTPIDNSKSENKAPKIEELLEKFSDDWFRDNTDMYFGTIQIKAIELKTILEKLRDLREEVLGI